ncbi:MAG: hypothetical protein P8M78_17510, partial [Myxococcota bacterium]|nr:hypothetical protein [Myxococcota bacterium]
AAHYLPWVWANLFQTTGPPSWGLVALTQLLYALPGLALVAVALRSFFFKKTPDSLFYLSALVMALWMQMYPRADWGHLVYVLPASFALLIATAASLPGRHEGSLAAVLTVVGVLALVAVSSWTWVRLESEADGPLAPPSVTLRPVSPLMKNPDLGRVIHYLREETEPGEAIWVARAEPLLYEATATRNPTRYGGVMPGLTESQDPEVIRALKEVRYVVMTDADSPDTQYLRESLPETQRYLEQHFMVPPLFVEQGSGLFVLKKSRDRGDSLIDFFDRIEQGKFFVRDASGRRRDFRRESLKFETRFNRRPLAVPVGARGGGIEYELKVPPGTVLEFSLGIGALFSGPHPFYQVPRSRFEILIGDSEGFKRLFSASYDQSRHDQSRKWTDYQIDLSEWGGQAVTLRFEVVAENPQRTLGVAWWGSPRLIERSAVGDGPVR